MKIKAYKKAGIKIGDRIKCISKNDKMIAIILSPDSSEIKEIGLSGNGDIFIYMKVESSNIEEVGYVDGWAYGDFEFEILISNNNIKDNSQSKKCVCEGSSEMLELFSSSILICSVCKKDK